jgi:NADH-quinone oxidoreductase subunit D
MEEMAQSCRILRQAIGMVPTGPFRARLPRLFKVPPGEVYLESENPRGQLGFFLISQGGPVPYRVKIRSPSFCNLSVISHLCRGLMLADIPAVIGSIDVVMGEVDR